MKLEWKPDGDTFVLGATIHVNGSASSYWKSLRRVRRSPASGLWYVQHDRFGSGWCACIPRTTYETLDEAKVAAEALVRPEELA